MDLSKVKTKTLENLNNKSFDLLTEVRTRKEITKPPKPKGRPKLENKPLDYKLTVNLTEEEVIKIKQDSDGVPLSLYIRKILKKHKVI